MAGHGQYPHHRLDRMPLAVAARFVSDRLQKESAHVWIVPTSGILLTRDRDLARCRANPERYRYAGSFTRDARLDDIAAALAPFAPRKVCNGCAVSLPLTDYHLTTHGHPRSRCKGCMAIDSASRRKDRPKPRKADPLNLALRHMPGIRPVLMGFPTMQLQEAA